MRGFCARGLERYVRKTEMEIFQTLSTILLINGDSPKK